MARITTENVLEVLKKFRFDGAESPLIQLGCVKDIQIKEKALRLILAFPAEKSAELSKHVAPLKHHLQHHFEDREIQLLVTSHTTQQKTPGQRPHSPQGVPAKISLPHIKRIIAVTSGKGGVGKSMVAINLALGLKQQDLRVGLLDLDIYGPSIPTMLDLAEEPQKKDGKLQPLSYKGLPVLSMGFLIPPEKAVIWRGPLVQKAVHQFLSETAWPELDVLILDTPPGTGDVHLSLAQLVPLSGAILVSTPQKMALIDAQKSFEMFQTVSVPVLGIVENMAYHSCTSCGAKNTLFDEKGGVHLAQKLHLPLLGQLPLAEPIRTSADQGKPFILNPSDDSLRQAFEAMSQKVSTLLKG